MSSVALEVAQDEFDRMLESFDIDIEDLDKEDSESFQTLKNLAIKGICKGSVTVAENGCPTVSLKYPVGEISSVTFRHPTGATLVAVGDKKAKNSTTQGYKLLEDFTGVPSAAFGKMRLNPDLKVIQALSALFLG